MTTKTPWAILLCRFKDDVINLKSFHDAARRFPFDQFANSVNAILAHRFDMPRPISLTTLIRNISEPNQVLQNEVALFTAPDIENIVTFWQDVSYGELDLSGSEVFGWLTLDQNRSDYTVRDSFLETWGKKAAADAGIDLSHHYGVVVFLNTATDLFGQPNFVAADIASNFSQILQEVGHGYGLEHSRSVANPTDYQNPFCIMSGLIFGGTNPTFQSRFGQSGPGLCSPYIFQAGWLAESRIARVSTNGTSPDATDLVLSPLSERNPAHPQVAMFDLTMPQAYKYFVEYRSGGWDRGLNQTAVVIHQLRADKLAYYAGSIATSTGFSGGGFGGGTVTLPGGPYADPQFDLSVQVLSLLDDGAVKIRIAPK